ncbi:MAG: hypothetical protein ACRC5T_03690 [Cetobacterium sp.]
MTHDIVIAPEYRYFTADLLTNEVLAEIPFSQVSYERSIKGAGNFTGSIPVIEATAHLNVYENTLPGNTALYVVRDGVCVWGGIIWNRSYSIVDEVLQVSADEFTSYFYKRKIWKTWNNAFGATVYVTGGLGEVTLDTGSNATFVVGSSVYIEFIDPMDSKYSGYYKVGTTPAPTTSKFYLESVDSIAEFETINVTSNRVFVTTKSNHGFNTGDKLTVTFSSGSGYEFLSGEYEIRNTPGANGRGFDFEFTTPNTATLPVTGTAARRLPSGTYTSATVQVRTDTYDYIRSLISAVASDFTGVDFPNEYIEPGVRRSLGVTQKEVVAGYATIDVESAHDLVPGQAVVLKNMGTNLDGEHVVTSTPTATSFSFASSGAVPTTNVVAIDADITSVAATNKLATVQTATPHGLQVGQTVSLSLETSLGDFDLDFNGEFVITVVPSTTSFQYPIETKGSLDQFSFLQPTVTHSAVPYELLSGLVVASGDPVTSSEATLRAAVPTPITVGSTVTVANANLYVPIVEKNYDAATDVATLVTAYEHGLQADDQIDLIGLQDSSAISGRYITGGGASKAVTLSTETAHNFKVGDVVTVADMYDEYAVTGKQITGSNTFTVTTASDHNLSTNDTVFVSGIVDMSNISKVKLLDNVATLTLDPTIFGSHNFRVNDKVTVTSLKDQTTIIAKEMLNGVATLTTLVPHNLQVGDEVIITGVDAAGQSKFNGTFSILNVGPEFIQYETATAAKIEEATTNYNVALTQAVARRVANPYTDATVVVAKQVLDELVNGTGSVPPTKLTKVGPGATIIPNYGLAKSMTSIFNGVHTISEVGTDTLKYALLGNNVPTTNTPLPTLAITSRSASLTECSLEMSLAAASTLAMGDYIYVPLAVFGARFSGDFPITKIERTETTATITYAKEGAKLAATVTAASITLLYRVFGASPFNGEFTVASTPTSKKFTFSLNTTVTERSATTTVCTLTFTTRYPMAVGDVFNVASVAARYNGSNFVVKTLTTSGTTTTITYDNAGSAEAVTASTGTITAQRKNTVGEIYVPFNVQNGDIQAQAYRLSIHNGDRTLTKVSRTSVTFNQTISYTIQPSPARGVVKKDSIFNGTSITLTDVTDTSVSYTLAGPKNNVIEEPTAERAYLICDTVFNGTFTVTDVSEDSTQFTVAVTLPGPDFRQASISERVLPGYGTATMKPAAIVSSFGPFPGNANIGFEFSTRGYSGVNILPQTYRGFELKNVGEVLNTYSDSINGFEYRVDAVYDATSGTFRKIFVLIPINFPAPPLSGEVSPASRFGADKLVFEYPGNITNVQINESAAQAATRFFVVGENDLSADAGPPFSVRAATQFLSGTQGSKGSRRWPLLDEDEKLSDTDDETLLYAQATRYLTEARPPEGQITVSVNGSLSPVVGTYAPGDWCSIIVDDPFILERMQSDIELRDDILIRKIDAIRVTVPDGTTFPEQVDLFVVPEWEVDRRGD